MENRRGVLGAVATVTGSSEHRGLGRNAAQYREKDTDRKSLHGDPRFTALVAHAKEVAQSKNAAAQKQNLRRDTRHFHPAG